jgi:hypothetical protein
MIEAAAPRDELMHKVVALHPPAAGDLAARLDVHDRQIA